MLNSPELLALGEATDLIPLAHIVGDKGLQQKTSGPTALNPIAIPSLQVANTFSRYPPSTSRTKCE